MASLKSPAKKTPVPAAPNRLAQRHVTMMGIGGVIGSGLFIGSGAGIAAAGPGVVVAYAAAGLVALCVTVALGQLIVGAPLRGSFSAHAEKAWGQIVGHTAGWLYWIMIAAVMALEAMASTAIVHTAAPDLPGWSLIPVLAAAVVACNVLSNRRYGETEFWAAWIKVAAIIVFMAIGVIWLLWGHRAAIPSITGEYIFPNGIHGFVNALILVIFAYGGIELVSFAAIESDEPARAMAANIRSTAIRIGLFYIGSMLVVVLVLPWREASSSAAGPYAAALTAMGLGSATSAVMSIVVFFTLISSMNAQLFGAARLLTSLAERDAAPRFLRATSTTGTPTRAVIMSVSAALAGSIIQLLWPAGAFVYLARAIGGIVLAVWILVGLTALRTHHVRGIASLPAVFATLAPIAVIITYGVLLGWSDLALTAYLTIGVVAVVSINRAIRSSPSIARRNRRNSQTP